MLAAASGAEPSCVSRREQKLDSVRWALTHGGQNPGTRDDDGFTAIHIAAASNKSKVLQLMLDMCRRSRELELIDLRDGEARPRQPRPRALHASWPRRLRPRCVRR